MSREMTIAVWSLIAIPAAVVSAVLTWMVGSPLYQSWNARDWAKVRAEVTWTELSGHGSGATVWGAYRYEFGGRTYEGDRLAFSTVGAGKLDSWPDDLYVFLGSARQEKAPVMVWMNPDNPGQSVVDRAPGTGTLLVLLPLAFVFVAITLMSLARVFQAWRSPQGEPLRDRASSPPSTRDLTLLVIWTVACNMIGWPAAIDAVVLHLSDDRWDRLPFVLGPLLGIWLAWKTAVAAWRFYRSDDFVKVDEVETA